MVTTFFSVDTDLILNIPLGDGSIEDKLFWYFDKRGHFSVKSGNKVVFGWKEDIPSAWSDLSCWWKLLQSLGIPSKLKIYLWKACRVFHLTFFNFARQKIPNDIDPTRGVESVRNLSSLVQWHKGYGG